MAVSSVEKAKDNSARMSAVSEIDRLLEGRNDFTERLAAQYMLNLIDSLDPNSSAAYRLCAAVEAQEREFEVDGKSFPVKRKKTRTNSGGAAGEGSEDNSGEDNNGADKRYYDIAARKRRNGVVAEDWQLLRARYQEMVDESEDSEPEELYKNLMRLATHLGLDEDEREILTVCFVSECDLHLSDYVSEVCDRNRENAPGIVAYMLGKPELYKKAQKLFSRNGALVKNGLVYYEDDADWGFLPEIDGVFWEALSGKNMSDDEIIGGVLGKATSTDLSIADFEHHGAYLDHALKIIKNAVEGGEKGVNILLHGPAGGGKTEMAKAIANELGVRLYSIGEEDNITPEGSPIRDYDGDIIGGAPKERGKAPVSVASRRMGQLRRAQALLNGNKDSVLLFDEMEDLLIKGTDSSKAADTESKIETNRLTENNGVVTIWCGNDVAEKFHPSMKQRFTYNIYVDYPPTMILRKIWQRQLEMNGTNLAEEDVKMLARKYSPAPRMIAKAAKAARLVGGGLGAIEESLRADAFLAYGNSSALVNEDAKGKVFKPDLLDDTALGLVEKLIARGRDRKPFALTVEGAEGVGTSAVLQYIGEEMSRTVAEVDMYSMVVSGPMEPSPPAKIQGAFNQANDNGLFLVFKNIEALADTPQNNWAKWKDGLTSFFMDCARAHGIPFAVITTKKDVLPDEFRNDFSHALTLGALDAVRAVKAYEYFLERAAPEALAEVKGLFVGDFEKVAALIPRLDDDGGDDMRVAMLQRQVLYRSTEGVKMGF